LFRNKHFSCSGNYLTVDSETGLAMIAIYMPSWPEVKAASQLTVSDDLTALIAVYYPLHAVHVDLRPYSTSAFAGSPSCRILARLRTAQSSARVGGSG
jgi:hypothetical protein